MKIIGNMVGCYSPFGKTVIIADSDGGSCYFLSFLLQVGY